MEDIAVYLKGLQKKLGFSDLGTLAKQLSSSSEEIKGILEKKIMPEDELCLRMAYLGGDDPAWVLAIAHYSSASMTTKPYWEKILLKYRDGRVLSPAAKDRRSWTERRLQNSKLPPNKGAGFPPQERRGRMDRRVLIDRRLPFS